MIGGAKQRGLQLGVLQAKRRADPSQTDHSFGAPNPGGRPRTRGIPHSNPPATQLLLGIKEKRPGPVPPPPVPSRKNHGAAMAAEKLRKERMKRMARIRAPEGADIL